MKILMMTSLFLLSAAHCFAGDVKVYTFSKPQYSAVDRMATYYYKEVNKELSKLNMKIELVAYPMARALKEVDKGVLDGDIGRTQKSLERAKLKNLYMIEASVGDILLRAAVRRDSKIMSFNELPKGITVGYLNGDFSAEEATKNYSRIIAKNFDQSSKMLKRKRVDLILIPELAGTLIYMPDFEEFRLLKDEINRRVLSPVLNIKYKDSAFEKALNAAIRKVSHQKILEKFPNGAFAYLAEL